MKLALKTLVPLLAVVALATACNPFTHGNSRSNGLQDPRFAPFTYTSDRKAKVQTRLDSFNERWPGMQATDGNVVAARTHSGFLHALDQDPEYWLTGVATVPTTTIDTLMESIHGSTSTCPRTAISQRSTPITPTPSSHPRKARGIPISEPCPSAL